MGGQQKRRRKAFPLKREDWEGGGGPMGRVFPPRHCCPGQAKARHPVQVPHPLPVQKEPPQLSILDSHVYTAKS